MRWRAICERRFERVIGDRTGFVPLDIDSNTDQPLDGPPGPAVSPIAEQPPLRRPSRASGRNVFGRIPLLQQKVQPRRSAGRHVQPVCPTPEAERSGRLRVVVFPGVVPPAPVRRHDGTANVDLLAESRVQWRCPKSPTIKYGGPEQEAFPLVPKPIGPPRGRG